MFILECLKSHPSILFLSTPTPHNCCPLSPSPSVGSQGRQAGWAGAAWMARTPPPPRIVASTPLGSASLTRAFWILSHHSSACDPISTLELWSGPQLIHTHCFQAKHEFVPCFAHVLPCPRPSLSAWRTPTRPPHVQGRPHLLCDTLPPQTP